MMLIYIFPFGPFFFHTVYRGENYASLGPITLLGLFAHVKSENLGVLRRILRLYLDFAGQQLPVSHGRGVAVRTCPGELLRPLQILLSDSQVLSVSPCRLE